MVEVRRVGIALVLIGCSRQPAPSSVVDRDAAPTSTSTSGHRGSLPLVLVRDVDLPGKPVRFDYQDIDSAKGHLVITHMNDASVVIVTLADGSTVKTLTGIPTARGVVVAPEVGRIFVTASPNKLVVIDNDTLVELARVDTGRSPDGVAWDAKDDLVAVSDQGDGAVSLIGKAGRGPRRQVVVGKETGNVVYDDGRGVFWVTVPEQLVAIDPRTAQVTARLALPGCQGAHGLRLHPDGASALVACEDNATVVRADLDPGHQRVVTAACGRQPDVLSIDPGLGWLYVAAESGDLTVLDIGKPGLAPIDREHPAEASHSVVVDPATHRVFFPLVAGPKGTPVLRIMRPAGLD